MVLAERGGGACEGGAAAAEAAAVERECTAALFATLSIRGAREREEKANPEPTHPLPPPNHPQPANVRFVFWIIFILEPLSLAARFSPFSLARSLRDSQLHDRQHIQTTPCRVNVCMCMTLNHPPSECMHTFQQCCSRLVYLCVADKHYVQRRAHAYKCFYIYGLLHLGIFSLSSRSHVRPLCVYIFLRAFRTRHLRIFADLTAAKLRVAVHVSPSLLFSRRCCRFITRDENVIFGTLIHSLARKQQRTCPAMAIIFQILVELEWSF